MLGDAADSERKYLDDFAQASLYHTSCSCFDEENRNEPVYIIKEINRHLADANRVYESNYAWRHWMER